MKPSALFVLLFLLVCCLSVSAACGEGVTVAAFLPAASCYHVDYRSYDDTLALDAVFYEDGSFHGVTDGLEETCGYYAIMPDGRLLLGIGAASLRLDRNENGGYSGRWQDPAAACTLTPIARSVFDHAAAQAGLYIDPAADRVDVPLWDYPVYARITALEGLDLLLNPDWPDITSGHLPEGAMVRILGQWYADSMAEGDYPSAYDEDGISYDILLVEADGIRGFALSGSLEEIPVRRAKVIRSPKNEKGRSVNIRSTPDFGDNVVQEVPYGETVDVLPVVEGEFTRVYYDYGEGWMTTVRLQLLDD